LNHQDTKAQSFSCEIILEIYFLGVFVTWWSWIYRLDGNFSRFPRAAFALQADVAGGIVAAGDFILGRAVDDDFNCVGFANNLIGVPFARRFFGGWQKHFNSVATIVNRLGAFRAAPKPEIALMIMHSLALDGISPDQIRRRAGIAILHENADAGVDGFGHRRRETPFDGDDVIAVIFFRAQIAVRFAGAFEQAVGDAPRFHRVGVAALVKCPTGEIFAIEKFDAFGLLRIHGQDKHQCKANGRDGFHSRKFNHQVTKTQSIFNRKLYQLGGFVPWW
jgi:hypothetical protein